MSRYPDTGQSPEHSLNVPPSVRSRLDVTSTSELFINAATDLAYRQHLADEAAKHKALETNVPSVAMSKTVDFVPANIFQQPVSESELVSSSTGNSSRDQAEAGQVLSQWDKERRAMMEQARQDMQNGFNN